jgi:Uma2 family endonuclease
MTVAIKRWRCSVDEYYSMLETGILTSEDRVELIDGEIVEMTPTSSGHAASVMRLNRLFGRAVGDRAVVSVQSPLRLDGWSEPEPDLMLLKPRGDFYSGEHPGPADALLVVEVSHTSVEYDRRAKLPLYARAGVAEVWVIVLPEDAIEVHRDPGALGYRQLRVCRRGDRLAPAALPDAIVTVDDIIGLST